RPLLDRCRPRASRFFFHCRRARGDLHSFPTRRSSDLARSAARRWRRTSGQSATGCASAEVAATRGGFRPAPSPPPARVAATSAEDRKSTRLNSSHSQISYAVFCLKKKTKETIQPPHTH